MAANDPTIDVPTPTGTLQGVAAFSWDGSAWQPSGRAGPSVATPTGVLRGIAAFNGGPAWQPAGQAQPGVATPTGVLDGAAVYTWSGSAWTPTGGTATPSTPSGALRGVAAFSWDGVAWQPAGQARPSVPTPYGVLDGVAMFGWTGSAWAAVAAPSLSLDFLTPGTLDPRITFTRASTATYFDATGTMQTAATNAPRWDYDPVTQALRGLLIEEARTNVLAYSADFTQANWSKTGFGTSAAPVVTANQAVAPDGTTTAPRIAFSAVASGANGCLLQQPYTASANIFTFSAWLRGNVGGEQLYLSATPDGATYYRAAITLTTSWQRFVLVTSALTAVPWYFQIGVDGRDASQTAKPAQTIYVWGAQTEQGAFVTSHIPTNNVGVTRAADAATMATAPWYNAGPGSAAATFTNVAWSGATGTNNGVFAFDNGAGNRQNTVELVAFASGNTFIQTSPDVLVAGGVTGNTAGPNVNTVGTTYTKAAVAWQASATLTVSANGGAVASAALTTLPAITRLTFGTGYGPIVCMNGYMRQFTYWPRVLSNTELQSVST